MNQYKPYTELEINQIIELNKQGKSLNKIAKILNRSVSAIVNNIKKRNIQLIVNHILTRLSPEKRQEIVNYYLNNHTQKETLNYYHISQEIFIKILKEFNIKKRRYFKYNCNLNAFDTLNEDVCYWLGIMFTDGCVHYGARCRAAITLGMKDREHICKFKEFLQSEHPVRRFETTKLQKDGNPSVAYRIDIHNKYLCNSIDKYGLQTEKPIDSIKNSIDFWRGAIDGDGMISASGRHKYLAITLFGQSHFLQNFKDFCSKYVDVSNNSISKSKSIFCFSLSGTKAETIIKLLYYPGCKYYLDRKMDRINTFFETGKINPYPKTEYEKINKETDFLPPKSKDIPIRPQLARQPALQLPPLG